LYVGKAINLKSRVSSYFTSPNQLGEKTRVLVSQIRKIKITIVESELEALLLEAFYIKQYNPKYNIKLTDNKSYIQIKITIKDKYPAVLLSRREDDGKSLYFGPYPSSSSVKLVLKTIRRIFPFVSVPNHPKRICLYNHLGLCPCPPINDSPELEKEYRKNIRGIVRMLEGESKKIMTEFEKSRDELSKNEEYEEALKIQKKIEALSFITTPFHRPFEYDMNPNLRTDIRQSELNELIAALNQKGFNLTKLNRIECYDISNTQGTNATASMVVFINGEKEGSQYRKFKIKKDGRPNDFAMMRETLNRRFKHEDWTYPDLLIVDGGKGQVGSALKAFQESGINLPLIGLAKREETIIIPLINNTRHSGKRLELPKERSQNHSETDPGQDRMTSIVPHRINYESDAFTQVTLARNSKALHLIQRIRDEAHRFAITYHRKLRSKQGILEN
jgi:excinuclease ABC subunit C